jgi:hypothetical protein
MPAVWGAPTKGFPAPVVWTLRPGWRVEQSADALLAFTDVRRIRITAPPELIDAVMRQLRGDSGRGVLDRSVPAVLQQLEGHGVISRRPTAASHRTSASAAQIDYLAQVCTDPDTAQQRIEAASVLILGIGGLGSTVLQHMVGAGVSRLVLVDNDHVESSNLTRQFVHSVDTVGRPKLASAARYVRQHSLGAAVTTIERRISTPADVEHVLGEAGQIDGVAICIDTPPVACFDMCGEVLWSAGMAFIYGGVMTQSAFYGPLFSPDHESPHPARFRLGDPDEGRQLTACFAPFNTITGASVATELLHHLAGAADLVDYQRRTFIDFLHQRWSKLEPIGRSSSTGAGT